MVKQNLTVNPTILSVIKIEEFLKRNYPSAYTATNIADTLGKHYTYVSQAIDFLLNCNKIVDIGGGKISYYQWINHKVLQISAAHPKDRGVKNGSST